MYNYFNDKNISGNKINISTSFPNDKTILAYASAPQIKPEDININILNSDIGIEETLIPNISSYYLNKGIKIWEKDLTLINEDQEYLVTYIFNDNNPLYYKEKIGYKNEIKNIIVLKDGVENTDLYKLIEINDIYYIIHSFNKEDNCSIIIINNNNEEEIKYPIYNPVIKKVNKDINISAEGDIYWVDQNKLYIRIQSEEYDYQILDSKDFRGRMPVAFNLTGSAKIDYTKLKELNISLGVVFLEDYDNNTSSYPIHTLLDENKYELHIYNSYIITALRDREIFLTETNNENAINSRFYFISDNNITTSTDAENNTYYIITIDKDKNNLEFQPISVKINTYINNYSKTFLQDIQPYFDVIKLKDNSSIITKDEIKTLGKQYDVLLVTGSGSHNIGDILLNILQEDNSENWPLIIIDNYSDKQSGLEILNNDTSVLSFVTDIDKNETIYGSISQITRIEGSKEKIYNYPIYKNSISNLTNFTVNTNNFFNAYGNIIDEGNPYQYNDKYIATVAVSNPFTYKFNIDATPESEYKNEIEADKDFNINTLYKYKNLIVSSQGITLTRNNRNIKNGIKMLEKLILKHFAIIEFETPIEKDYILPKNSLKDIDFSINNYEIGYENINNKNMFVGRKIISNNINDYILSFIGINNINKINIENNDNIKIHFYDRFYNEIVEENILYNIEANKPFYFYLPIDISATEDPNPRLYSDILNKNEHINLTINMLKDGNIIKTISKEIELKYLPRKKILFKLNDIIQDNFSSLSFDAIEIIPKNQDINIYIKELNSNKYFLKDGFAYIKKDNINDNIVIEGSLTTYSIISSNTKLSIKSLDYYNDIVKIDNNLKTSNPWFINIKNINTSVKDNDYTYIYKTPEFNKQIFVREKAREVIQEKANFININTIQCSHNNLCLDQYITTTNEELIKLTNYVYFAKNNIDQIIRLTNSLNQKIDDEYYTVQNNFIIFKQENILNNKYYLTYKTNKLKIYNYETEIKSAIKEPLIPTFNSTNILRISNNNDSILNENGIIVWKEVLENGEIKYQEINSNALIILKDCGTIIVNEENSDQYNYFWSGSYCKKQYYNINDINYNTGILSFNENIDYRKTIYCDYLYEENYFYYIGYKNNLLDLNPLMDHKYYIDNKSYNSINLVDKPIYIYLKPYQIIDNNGFIVEENEQTIYHCFDELEFNIICKNKGIIPLAIICLTNNYDLYDVNIMDARTLGGGIKEDVIISDFDSQFYFDVLNNYNIYYNPNGFAIIKLPKQLLKENRGMYEHQDIEKIINMYRPVGVKYIIDYYDAEIDPIINKLE